MAYKLIAVTKAAVVVVIAFRLFGAIRPIPTVADGEDGNSGGGRRDIRPPPSSAIHGRKQLAEPSLPSRFAAMATLTGALRATCPPAPESQARGIFYRPPAGEVRNR
jgi:hypothetical protein